MCIRDRSDTLRTSLMMEHMFRNPYIKIKAVTSRIRKVINLKINLPTRDMDNDNMYIMLYCIVILYYK